MKAEKWKQSQYLTVFSYRP